MSRPPIFQDLSFEAALTQATEQDKVLLVDASAAWCGPCRTMDRTTWVSEEVVTALEPAAIAIQFDVDEDRALNDELQIRAMPTVVAFRNGKELERVVGLQRPRQLVEWVAGLREGKTRLQKLQESVEQDPRNVDQRMTLLRQLLEAEDLAGATEQALWLWSNMLDVNEAYQGVRHSYLLEDLRWLAHGHPPARQALTAMRDAATPTDAASAAQSLHDWLSLNTALGESDKTVTWFDENRTRGPLDVEVARLLEHHIGKLLAKQDRWTDLADLYPDPLATLDTAAQWMQRALADLSRVPPEMAEQLKTFLPERLREDTEQMVHALRAAGRTEELEAVSKRARELDDSAAMNAVLS